MNNISSTNIVTINRGDTFSFKYYINLGDELNPCNYILTETDRLYVGVCEPRQAFEDAIIKKVYTHNDMIEDYINITFKSLDTEYLMPGKYYYTIKLCRNKDLPQEEITTLVNKKLFWIIGEAPEIDERVERLNGLLVSKMDEYVSEIKSDLQELQKDINIIDNENDEQDNKLIELAEINEQQDENFKDTINEVNNILKELIG